MMRDFLCRIGIHPEWRENIYEDTAKWFLYCPNCHKHKKLPDTPNKEGKSSD